MKVAMQMAGSNSSSLLRGQEAHDFSETSLVPIVLNTVEKTISVAPAMDARTPNLNSLLFMANSASDRDLDILSMLNESLVGEDGEAPNIILIVNKHTPSTKERWSRVTQNMKRLSTCVSEDLKEIQTYLEFAADRLFSQYFIVQESTV
jgi:hypothetical protein